MWAVFLILFVVYMMLYVFCCQHGNLFQAPSQIKYVVAHVMMLTLFTFVSGGTLFVFKDTTAKKTESWAGEHQNKFNLPEKENYTHWITKRCFGFLGIAAGCGFVTFLPFYIFFCRILINSEVVASSGNSIFSILSKLLNFSRDLCCSFCVFFCCEF